MTKRIILGFSAAIVVVVLLLAGSSLGAYVRAQVEEREAGAIACGDSVSCSRTDQVIKVINTGNGHGILGKTASTTTTKAAVIGNATKKARGVYGKSKNGVGVFGESTSAHGIKGLTGSSDYQKAAVYGISTSNARGVLGKHSGSGNVGYLGGSLNAVYGASSGAYAGYFDGVVLVNGHLKLLPEPAPTTCPSGCVIWCDETDGDLKVRFSNGTVKTIANN